MRVLESGSNSLAKLVAGTYGVLKHRYGCKDLVTVPNKHLSHTDLPLYICLQAAFQLEYSLYKTVLEHRLLIVRWTKSGRMKGMGWLGCTVRSRFQR